MSDEESASWDDAPWNDPTIAKTRIAAWRMARGLTQRELADRSGISLGTIRRLERGELSNPGIRYLTNVAIALSLDGAFDVCEDEWLERSDFTSRREH